MSITDIADVAGRWGGHEVTDEEASLIEIRIGDVERKIRRRIKDLDARILAGTTDVEDVRQVVADAILRLVKNPDGYLSETDGNYTYMLSQDTASGKLMLTDEDWITLGWRASRMVVLIPTFEFPT